MFQILSVSILTRLTNVARSTMSSPHNKALPVAVMCFIASLWTTPGQATDYQPFDFVPAAPGTAIVMGYYEYGTRSSYNNTITGTADHDTSLDSNLGIFRPLYYNQVFGHPYLVELLLPFGAFSNGKINGTQLNDASGVGDLTLSGTFWLISRPESKSWFSISEWITAPSGSYDHTKSLNLGANRWQNDVQLDLTKGLSEKFTFDVAFDWIRYGDNTNSGTLHQTLSQEDSYSAYMWLSYDISDVMRRAMASLGNASISLGYAGTFGGSQKVDGVPTGGKTEEHQIRLTYEQFIAPTWQVLLSLNHDVAVTGQFKQDFGLVFRVAKVF